MDGACIDVVLFQRTLLRFLANEDKQAGIKSNINCFFCVCGPVEKKKACPADV